MHRIFFAVLTLLTGSSHGLDVHVNIQIIASYLRPQGTLIHHFFTPPRRFRCACQHLRIAAHQYPQGILIHHSFAHRVRFRCVCQHLIFAYPASPGEARSTDSVDPSELPHPPR